MPLIKTFEGKKIKIKNKEKDFFSQSNRY